MPREVIHRARGPTAAEAEAAWLDPEFWGPPGLGCARCHERPPLVPGLPEGAPLCWRCLQVATGREGEGMLTWLDSQRRMARREGERAGALSGMPQLIERYRQEYGVDLRPEGPPRGA